MLKLLSSLHSTLALLALSSTALGLPELGSPEADALHFHLHARATNKNGSPPTYKDPNANIEDRVSDLLSRMTIEEKVAQMYVKKRKFLSNPKAYVSPFLPLCRIQGDIGGWMDFSDPLDDTLTFNATGLADMIATKAGSIVSEVGL